MPERNDFPCTFPAFGSSFFSAQFVFLRKVVFVRDPPEERRKTGMFFPQIPFFI